MKQPVLLIHGGAGDINDASASGKIEGMKAALHKAYHLLLSNDNEKDVADSSSALDAVEAAVRSMELDDYFNAGFGACLNYDGNVEIEASIMEGNRLKAGCVTLLNDIMHPISVARKVMEKTNHTFLGGTSAMEFARKEGFEQLEAGSLVTKGAQKALMAFKERERLGLDTTFASTELDRNTSGSKNSRDDISSLAGSANNADRATNQERPGEPGTVGAVAIDSYGNIAVATSTGGITGKVAGRIGDTPILGCGTYADNQVGGVSTTGHGETIMRFILAQKILQKIKYEKISAQQATKECCEEMTERLNGTGGAITIDLNGDIGIYWTSKRMAWAYMKGNELVYGVNHGEVFRESTKTAGTSH